MKRKLWYTCLPDKYQAILNAVVLAFGDAAPEPEEGEDGCFVLPMRPGMCVGEGVLKKVAELARNFVIAPGSITVYYAGTQTIVALEMASLERRAARATASVTIVPSSFTVSTTTAHRVAVAKRQMAEVLHCNDCKPHMRFQRVSLEATKLQGPILWSEVAELLIRLAGYQGVGVSLRFPDKAVEFSIDMSSETQG